MGLSKRELEQQKKVMTQFMTEQHIEPPKCISDQTELYIRYLLHHLHEKGFHVYDRSLGHNIPATREEVDEDCDAMSKRSYKLMKDLRGSILVSNSVPRGMAAGIVYIACVMEGCNITQKEIGDILHVADSAIRKNYHKIKKELKL